MPKRKHSEEILVGPSLHTEPKDPSQASEGGTVEAQPAWVEGLITSGNPGIDATTSQVDEIQALDSAAEELLATSPFWALLMDAGYTWW